VSNDPGTGGKIKMKKEVSPVKPLLLFEFLRKATFFCDE
jgi:hypothetical protein